MTDPKTNINYSVDDIARYISGGMNAKEMHDMEKAALQDSFLADAIEGYSEASMQQSRKHLNEITALLQQENTTAKVVIMPAKSFSWWRVAAMVILIAGVGAFSLYLFDKNKQPAIIDIAAVKESKDQTANRDTTTITIETDAGNSTSKADTTTYIAKNITAKKQKRGAEIESVIVNEKAVEATLKPNLSPSADYDKNIQAMTAQTNIDTVSFDFKTIRPGLQLQKADTNNQQKNIVLRGVSTNNIKLNNFSGYIKDNNNQPVTNAFVNVGRQQAVVTDKNGYFNFLAPDSVLQVSVSSVGFQTANANIAQGAANNIIIAPDMQSLSEIVVTGYTSKKKEETKNHADTTFPAGGWESFQQYVYRKMNMPFDSANANYSTQHGDVEIEFSVNENGDPYNFKVLRSLGKENDDKAIDAIKNGPRWITSRKNRKAKVAISL